MQGVGESGHGQVVERRFAWEGYVTRIPESTQSSLRQRLVRRQRERWPQLTEVRVRFRNPFAYVDGVLPDGEVLPLCRLRYAGWAGLWGFAIYSGSGNRYENSVLPNGDPIGEPHEAFDCACGLYLGDPSAWSRTSADDH
jgi:hypothetical protein